MQPACIPLRWEVQHWARGRPSCRHGCRRVTRAACVFEDWIILAASCVQAAALSRKTQIIEYTTIPILAVCLVAAFVALAALTGCFGAKQAAVRAAAAAKVSTPAAKGGAYAASGPIPITVSTR